MKNCAEKIKTNQKKFFYKGYKSCRSDVRIIFQNVSHADFGTKLKIKHTKLEVQHEASFILKMFKDFSSKVF